MNSQTNKGPAFAEGQKARQTGLQLNQNPYDPEAEMQNHEDWIDGWLAHTQKGDGDAQ